MSNNRAVEGDWSVGSEGRIIAEKSGVVVGQCLWQEDAELIVAMRNGLRMAQLESAVARVEAAIREAKLPLPPGNLTAKQIADSIAKLAADLEATRSTVRSVNEEAEQARKGWRDEIEMRRADAETNKASLDELERLRTRYKELEVRVADGQRREAFEDRAAHVDGQKRKEKR